MIAMIVDLEHHPFPKIIFLLQRSAWEITRCLAFSEPLNGEAVFFVTSTQVFYVLGRIIVGLKISDPKKCFIFQWPKIDTSCIKLLVSTGGRVQNTYEISSFFLCKNTRHATLPSGRRLTAHPWRWEAWCCCFFPLVFLQKLSFLQQFVCFLKDCFYFCAFFISARLVDPAQKHRSPLQNQHLADLYNI